MSDSQAGGCMAHFGQSGIDNYCAAIQQLLEEHPPLRLQMEQLLLKAKQVVAGDQSQYTSDIEELHKLERKFKEELETHSEKEEKGLFPIVGRHIGTQSGPIFVMEYEHSEAKRNLSVFEQQVAGMGTDLSREQAGMIVNPLLSAIHILFDHFVKEENVLFPMAEKILSVDEKEELLGMVRS